MGGVFSSDTTKEVPTKDYNQYTTDKPAFLTYEKKKKIAAAARKLSLAKIKNINIKYEILSSISNGLYYMIFTMFSYIILSFCSHLTGNGLSNWVLIMIYAVLWFMTIFINFSDSDNIPNGLWGHSWGWLLAMWLIIVVVVTIVTNTHNGSFGAKLLGVNDLQEIPPISNSFKDAFIKTTDEGFASKIVVIGLLLHILTIIYYSFSWNYPTQIAVKAQTILQNDLNDPSLFT
tara:strand:- start:841 stop:1536 length:696 start_codon:yes stop_codon:yes gene_type:complete